VAISHNVSVYTTERRDLEITMPITRHDFLFLKRHALK
jgi:hypothetical protein